MFIQIYVYITNLWGPKACKHTFYIYIHSSPYTQSHLHYLCLRCAACRPSGETVRGSSQAHRHSHLERRNIYIYISIWVYKYEYWYFMLEICEFLKVYTHVYTYISEYIYGHISKTIHISISIYLKHPNSWSCLVRCPPPLVWGCT
jgi:hypothetical protein